MGQRKQRRKQKAKLIPHFIQIVSISCHSFNKHWVFRTNYLTQYHIAKCSNDKGEYCNVKNH